MLLRPVLLIKGSTFQGRNGNTTQDPAVSSTPQHLKPRQLLLCSLEGSVWWFPALAGLGHVGLLGQWLWGQSPRSVLGHKTLLGGHTVS